MGVLGLEDGARRPTSYKVCTFVLFEPKELRTCKANQEKSKAN